MKLYLGLALLTAATARKAPKKFESAKEMTLDAPALEAKGDQLFCVAPPDEAALKLVFASITWDIEFKPDSRGRARAVSDDDFHEAGRSLVGKIIRRSAATSTPSIGGFSRAAAGRKWPGTIVGMVITKFTL